MNGSPPEALSAHADFIKSRLPTWLTGAPKSMRTALRDSLIKSNRSRHDLKEFLHTLPSPERFSRTLLKKALRRRFPGKLTDENATLSREWKHHHLLGLIKTHAQTTEQSLLEAAMQNFEASEAQEDGMEKGSGLYTTANGRRQLSSVTPAQFAELCRNLDLGTQYQEHLDQVLNHTYSLRMTNREQKLFVEHAKNAFTVEVHLQYLLGRLPVDLYSPLLDLAREGRHPDLICHHLTIGGVVLPSVLVIEPKNLGPYQWLYTPHDADTPLRRHSSLEDLQQQLAERLHKSTQYSAFFKSLVPLRHRETLLAIKPAWADWYSVGATGKIVPTSLENALTCTPIRVHVFLAVARQRIHQIKDDARTLVVPTADADLAARQKRLQAYADFGKSLLFFAASFIPIVGEVLLVVSAAQLLETVYNGFAAWSRGDSQEALEDLLDVVDNVALAAATAGAVKTVGFTAGLVRVKLRQGGERLWQPDLAPYHQHNTVLPSGLAADAQGIYTHQGQQYLKLDEQLHAIKRDPKSQQWQLQHPSDVHAYTPPLLTNGAGGWRHVHESARDWDDLKLIKRMGPDAANITAPQVQPILLLSGLDSTVLRQAHEQALRPPPMLRDTLKRFNLEHEISGFDAYRAEGTDVTPYTPYLQLHLVCSLPEWPAGRALNVVDEHGVTVISQGSGTTEMKMPLARFQRGDLLHYLEQHLPRTEFNELLPASREDPLGNVENLAKRLTEEAVEHKQRLFTWMMQTLGTPTSAVEHEIAQLLPDLPKSHREEMAAVLNPAQQRRLQLEKSLTAQQHWEADQYLQQLRVSRAHEGLHLDATETPAMVLATLDQIPGWPAACRLEVREQSATGTLLHSTGAEDAPRRYVIIREGERYRLHNAQNPALHEPTDLLGAITPVLSTPELMAVLRQTGCRTLKDAMRQVGLRALGRRPQASRARLSRSASFPASRPIDPLFADATPPGDLALRSDGLYQTPPLPDGSVRVYAWINANYYRVRPDNADWRLLDVRSPFRAYQPYIRPGAEGDWDLDESLERSPTPESRGAHSTSSAEEFVSAESASEYESADEGSTVYTPAESRRMRSSNCYQHSQNYRRQYDRANNGRYPLRDLEGRPMRVRFIESFGTSEHSTARFNKSLIMPFIRWEGFEKVAALYDDKLEVTAFTAAHQKFPEEAALLGEMTVVTTQAIQKGEPLGVYGGELVPLPVAEIRNDPYLLDVFVHKKASSHLSGTLTSTQISPDVALSGDNILSRINTLFEYEHGRPVRQARTGYNVVEAGFTVDTQVGNQPMVRLRLTGFFASEDLNPGTELRWNYGYDERTIQRLFPQPD